MLTKEKGGIFMESKEENKPLTVKFNTAVLFVLGVAIVILGMAVILCWIH